MARRGVRIAAVSGLAAAGLLLASVPVRAAIARLTSLPLGEGTATVTWAGTSGISPTLNSVSGSAHGLPIAATGTVHTPSPGTPLSSTIPFLHITGTLDGVPFTVDVGLTLSGLNLQSNKSQTFGAVTGSFRGQSVNALLTSKLSSSTLQFKGTIGGDHVTGTIGKVVHRGNRSTAHATFDVSKWTRGEQERFGAIDFDWFHLEHLPALLEQRGDVFSDSDAAVVRPLAFELSDGRAYTYVPDGRTFAVRPGTAAAHTIVELSPDAWSAFAWELKTCFALLYAEQLTVRQGSFGQVARWEPPLRVAVSDQVLFDLDTPARIDDEDGHAIDLARTFALGDPPQEIRDFLHRAGFVHLRGVLDGSEVGALTSDVELAVDRARPDDRKSWWTTVDGREVCNRVNYLNEHSERIAALGADPRFLAIAALGGPELRDAHDRLDGNGVVIKVPGSSGGLADLPWHRDCGMGGHSVKCPMLNVGIQLDAAAADAGQLEMIPGSHRGTSRLPSARDAARHPVVALTTEPGDVTVHFGHTLHAAPPPSDPRASGRRALYLSFVPPLTFEMVGPGQGYNDVLFTRSDGRVQHVDQFS